MERQNNVKVEQVCTLSLIKTLTDDDRYVNLEVIYEGGDYIVAYHFNDGPIDGECDKSYICAVEVSAGTLPAFLHLLDTDNKVEHVQVKESTNYNYMLVYEYNSDALDEKQVKRY